jgi:predicted TIM-barrel fold metal-dependent hydrolase
VILDFHTHLGRGEPGADELQRDILPAQLISVMDEAGVDRAVCFPVTYTDYRSAIREIADAVADWPDRLIGFARVGDTPDAPDILRWAVNELGMQGLKLHHGCDSIDPEGPNLHAVMGAAQELDIPVIFDCFGERASLVIPLTERYTCPIVLGHMGGLWNIGWIDRCIEAARRHPHVYLETSSVLLFGKIEKAVAAIGSERVLFGTDGPPIHARPEIEKIRILHVSDQDKANILGLNAARLLKLDVPAD